MRTSFLIPVYNPDLSVLRLCVNSALKAAGDEHEVVVVDDASDRTEISEFLSRCEGSGLENLKVLRNCLLYTSPSPRDLSTSRMPSSA